MKKPLIAMAALSMVIATPFAQTKQDPQYATPLKTPYRISGTYAELRGNHFHAGLDMGTAGVENIEVHAAESGYVSRVKVGPYGYGRALYITHPDGFTTVYGHLNGFAPKIDSLVRREQYARQSFAVEIFPAKGVVNVTRDEVVAYSGNTGGSGGPHLHFEVRETKSEEPVNPMRFITTDADNVPPTIFGIKIYALGDDAQVAGGQNDRYLPLAQANGRTIDACGEIGLGIHCTDYVARGGRPCGVVEINLYDGDELVFHSRVDHFPFALNRHINSHIDLGESRRNRRYIQRSYVSPGNKLPIYGTTNTPTTIGEGETHKFRFEVIDFAGNKSKVAFTLRGRRNKALGQRPTPKGELVRWERTWAKDTLGVGILIPHHSLFEDTYIDVSRTDRGASLPPTFTIGDPSIAMQKPMTLTMTVPDKWKDLGRKVFVGQAVGKSLTYIGGETQVDTGARVVHVINAKVSQLGTYSLGVDTIAPHVRINNKSNALSRDSWILIGVTDDVSGIANYSVWIDGKWEVFEYDYKNNRLKAKIDYLGIGRGRHTLRAVVEDSCGNTTERKWTFNVN